MSTPRGAEREIGWETHLRRASWTVLVMCCFVAFSFRGRWAVLGFVEGFVAGRLLKTAWAGE